MSNDYSDIIHLPHHVSADRPHMSMEIYFSAVRLAMPYFRQTRLIFFFGRPSQNS